MNTISLDDPRPGPLLAVDAVLREPSGPLADVHTWMTEVIAQRHPVLERTVCPFVAPALERGTLQYSAVTGCRRPDDVVAVMEQLVERFLALPPQQGPDSRVKTVVAVFVDVEPEDAERVVIAAHRELKDKWTPRGLMVGEFAPGYRLASTRNPAVDVGDAPAPVLALRHMLLSDRRFLSGEDHWMAAWASHFGADRVPLFRDFTGSELAAISRVSGELTAAAGAVLCEQGQPGHEFFLIVDGQATVRRNGRTVAELGPGSYFGELALLTRHPRNATVTADTEMTLFVLDRRRFREVLDSIPVITHKLIAGLAERLSEADTRSVHG